MALIKCSECKAKVSDKATACPQCGAPVVVKPKPKKPEANAATVGCAIVLMLGLFGAIASVGSHGGGGNQAAADTNSSASESAEEKAQNERATMAGLAVASLKQALRDPDSFKLERAFTTMDAKYA